MIEKISSFCKTAVLFLISTFAFVAIVNYNSTDPSLNTVSTLDYKFENPFGIVGAYLSDIVVQIFGVGGILVPIFSIMYLVFRSKFGNLLYVLFWSILLVTICGLISKTSLEIFERYHHGGFIGDIFSRYSGYTMVSMITFSVLGIIGYHKIYLHLKGLLYKLLIRVTSPKVRTSVSEKEDVEEDNIFPPIPIEQTRDSIVKKIQNKVQNKVQKICMDETFEEFSIPPLTLLTAFKATRKKENAEIGNVELLKEVLNDFGIQGEIINICYGPVVILYELSPSAGTKSSRVIGLSDDIARSMCALSARIAVVPGKNVIGIELPKHNREIVVLRELLESKEYQDSSMALPITLGKAIDGSPVVVDLGKMPHLLVAGTTGSGKSVAINTMILSILYKLGPEQCKMIMIDPKMLELSVYDSIPHLLAPVVTDAKKAISALKWVVKEMEVRYQQMSTLGVRNIYGYNEKINEAIKTKTQLNKMLQVGFDKTTGEAIFEKIDIKSELFPYIVVIVDEMADLMIVAGKEIEMSIQRLAQMARAAGIHLILATQRPSVDVITGVIKANFPTRISFAVTSKIDSRTILGEQGAEQLLGMGDMLYMASGGKIIRVHGPFVSDSEVLEVVNHLKSQGKPEYKYEIVEESDSDDVSSISCEGGEDDSMYNSAVDIVKKHNKVSISYIQRQLRIGYNRAANIVEKMEKEGVVSPAGHSGKREVIDS